MDSYKVRKRIRDIVEPARRKDGWSQAYDYFMFVVIIASVAPLISSTPNPAFIHVEIVSTIIFIIDYILRWSVADITLPNSRYPFLLYPITPMAIIDLLSILPGLHMLGGVFKVFRVTRLMRMLRLLKFIRYSPQIQILLRVLRKERVVLLSVMTITVFCILLTAIIMFNIEPRCNPATGAPTFETFFDALYWSTETLTSVGYGDVCPVTDFGRFISMISSLFSVILIALPSGVITASYLDELRRHRERLKNKEN